MKHLPFLYLAATILTSGCAAPVSVTLHDDTSGEPIADALIQRLRKPNFWERTINPVGAFYHDYWTVETAVTDEKGTASLKRMKPGDRYDIVADQRVPISAEFGTNTVILRQGTNIFESYHYSIRPSDDWSYSVQSPWFNVEHQKSHLKGRCKP